MQFEIGKDWAASASALLPYRLGLLSDAHRSALKQGKTDALRDEALQALYAPAAFGRVVPAAQDLTGLLSGFVLGQSQLAGRRHFGPQPAGGPRRGDDLGADRF